MSFQLVKASELEQQVLKESTEKLDELLKKIDRALRASAKTSGYGAVNAMVDVKGFNKFVIDKAIQECSRAGWEAKYTYDQRDGDFLAIVKRRTRSSSFEFDPREFGGSDRDYGFGAQ